jgi:isochorismate hydrolase
MRRRTFCTVMVHDAHATHRDEEHTSALIAFSLTCGDVRTTGCLIAGLERNARDPRAA